jgi:hypothetical protein
MITFAELWERMEARSPLMDSGEENSSNQTIRAGEQLRKEGEPSFWDDFLNILSNTDGVAELLNVSKEKVLSWPSRIREARQKTKQNQSSEEEESQIKPTGDNGAVVATNQDPII